MHTGRNDSFLKIEYIFLYTKNVFQKNVCVHKKMYTHYIHLLQEFFIPCEREQF